jgi:hypothetical protein
MRKLLFGMALTLPIAFASPATALPAAYPLIHADAVKGSELIEVKGGRGHGHGWGSRTRLSSVRLEPRPQGRLARPRLPARSLEEGLVLRLNRMPLHEQQHHANR